eukprot:TRINITY_DN3281_c0_g1_i1.p2 TRINITY_DN3281_c0_g1~~TRINITY_DN3281_c0_g1_i1.p2  ORF type:complete len:271 (+),score=117.13 TRINITY_DN3281_c0_g1_i1:28-840(+)
MMSATSAATRDAQMNWGDDDDFEAAPVQNVERSEIPEEILATKKDGEKFIVEYINSGDQKLKIIKKVITKHLTINKSVVDRRNWKKFEASGTDAQADSTSSTHVSDEVPLDIKCNYKPKAQKQEIIYPNLLCRRCGTIGDHWTHKCSLYSEQSANKDVVTDKATGTKYVIPSKRHGYIETPDNRRDDSCTLRVTNISQDVTEDILRDLFSTVGDIARLFLPIEKHNGLCKGFAYISYYSERDADTAVKKLHGKGLGHTILSVEKSNRNKT